MARAGLFRDRVTFQRLDSGTVDAYGNVYTGWANLATRADSVTSAVTAADRVVARGITWAIKNCTQVDAKDTLVEFILEKGVAS